MDIHGYMPQLGLMVCAPEPVENLPFHFVIHDKNGMSFVRVRRLKYPGYDVAAIEHSCSDDIAVLRALPDIQEIFREIWVRGPDREWHRYHVLPGSIEILDNRDEPGSD
jgi:hypothetical protein